MSSVYLIDDDASFRESTGWLLEAHDFSVQSFESAISFLNHCHDNPLEESAVIISDVRMPDKTGIELLADLFQMGISNPVIMITGHGEVHLAVEAMKNGAYNFIQKPFEADQLISSILDTVNNPSAQLRSTENCKDQLDKLSPREKQVLKLVCAGKLNKTIADILGISIKTVELHRSNLQSKLNTRSVQDLVRLTLGYH